MLYLLSGYIHRKRKNSRLYALVEGPTLFDMAGCRKWFDKLLISYWISNWDEHRGGHWREGFEKLPWVRYCVEEVLAGAGVVDNDLCFLAWLTSTGVFQEKEYAYHAV